VPKREPLYAGQFEIPIATRPIANNRKPGNIRDLKKEKKAIMLAAEFDPNAFNATQDELEYAYAVRTNKEKKRAARARTKGIKALSAFIAQALLRRS